MKIVIDTNVVASAIFFGGRPRDLIEKLMLHDVTAYVSQEIVEEYQDTVQRLKDKFPGKKVTIPLTQIVSACLLIEPATDIKVCRDPDDDKFIECAVDSKSVYIVSGDHDLLVLEKYHDIEIITVAEFFRRYEEHH